MSAERYPFGTQPPDQHGIWACGLKPLLLLVNLWNTYGINILLLVTMSIHSEHMISFKFMFLWSFLRIFESYSASFVPAAFSLFVCQNSRAVADIACSLSIWAIKLSLLLTNLEPLMVSSVLLGTRSSHLELNDLVHLWKIFHYHLDLRTSSRVFAHRLSSAFTGWNSTV